MLARLSASSSSACVHVSGRGTCPMRSLSHAAKAKQVPEGTGCSALLHWTQVQTQSALASHRNRVCEYPSVSSSVCVRSRFRAPSWKSTRVASGCPSGSRSETEEGGREGEGTACAMQLQGVHEEGLTDCRLWGVFSFGLLQPHRPSVDTDEDGEAPHTLQGTA
jgi:hypothetical protein